MQAGLLVERIKIITPTIVKNEYGEEETEWVEKYSTRARYMHVGGSRAIQNDEVVYDYTKTFQVRIYVPIDEFDRVIWREKIYRVMDIEPDEKQRIKTINVQLVND